MTVPEDIHVVLNRRVHASTSSCATVECSSKGNCKHNHIAAEPARYLYPLYHCLGPFDLIDTVYVLKPDRGLQAQAIAKD
jgi:hypothetical protein